MPALRVGNPMNPNPNHTFESIRRALIDAAEAAYEDAGIQGLCAEGRWEAAVSAMRGVDVEAVVHEAAASTESSSSAESSSTESTPSAESSPSTAIPEQ
jgi:ribosomal protein L12E/L44/L45/RPP1/RPP2